MVVGDPHNRMTHLLQSFPQFGQYIHDVIRPTTLTIIKEHNPHFDDVQVDFDILIQLRCGDLVTTGWPRYGVGVYCVRMLCVVLRC